MAAPRRGSCASRKLPAATVLLETTGGGDATARPSERRDLGQQSRARRSTTPRRPGKHCSTSPSPRWSERNGRPGRRADRDPPQPVDEPFADLCGRRGQRGLGPHRSSTTRTRWAALHGDERPADRCRGRRTRHNTRRLAMSVDGGPVHEFDLFEGDSIATLARWRPRSPPRAPARAGSTSTASTCTIVDGRLEMTPALDRARGEHRVPPRLGTQRRGSAAARGRQRRARGRGRSVRPPRPHRHQRRADRRLRGIAINDPSRRRSH